MARKTFRMSVQSREEIPEGGGDCPDYRLATPNSQTREVLPQRGQSLRSQLPHRRNRRPLGSMMAPLAPSAAPQKLPLCRGIA
jgi:hypothetical protein